MITFRSHKRQLLFTIALQLSPLRLEQDILYHCIRSGERHYDARFQYKYQSVRLELCNCTMNYLYFCPFF